MPFCRNFRKTANFPQRPGFRVNIPFSGHKLQLFGCIEAARVSISYTTGLRIMQAKCSSNLFTLFDFGLLTLGQ